WMVAEPSKQLRTKRARVQQRSAENPEMVFNQLMHHFNERNLRQWFHELKGKAATGIDGISKADYGKNLDANIQDLHRRLKAMSYRPSPVRQVWIPKDGQPNKQRPLGIGTFEGKIVEKGIQQILEAIYEPLFYDCSYGFRPKRGCHDAIKALRTYLYEEPVQEIIDLDLSNYFGTIDHELLMAILSEKIQDKRFLRYIKRLLKAGILDKDKYIVTDEGVPQGSVCRPVLANIFAHVVLDDWFEKVVKVHCRGKVALFRYADDAVICCQYSDDVQRIHAVIGKRLAKYRLKLNEEKTHVVRFNRADRKGSGVFDFLGFTFYLGLSQAGRTLPKVKSSSKKLRVKLKRVSQWCKENRNLLRLRELWKSFCSKLRGHIQYYGVTFNAPAVGWFVRQSIQIFVKWLNRRSQRRSMNFEQFNQYMQIYPAPLIRIHHKLY
ncbi:MAG: group II intron reverse transcriptase/maturase, partial [Chlorobiales bacterium]|nr:group II intron reverse transcriptase/maturase [Chlorobiales bacterium]